MVRGEPVNEEAAGELVTLEPERDRLTSQLNADEEQWDRDLELWIRSGRPEDELQELNTRNRELHRRGAEIRQMNIRIRELRHPDYRVYTTPAAEPRLTPQPSDGAPETGAEQYTVGDRATDRWEASMGVQSIEDEVGGSLDHGMIYLGRVNDPRVQREVLRDIKRDGFGDKEYTYTDYADGSQKTTTVTAYLQDLYGLSPAAEADVSQVALPNADGTTTAVFVDAGGRGLTAEEAADRYGMLSVGQSVSEYSAQHGLTIAAAAQPYSDVVGKAPPAAPVRDAGNRKCSEGSGPCGATRAVPQAQCPPMKRGGGGASNCAKQPAYLMADGSRIRFRGPADE